MIRKTKSICSVGVPETFAWQRKVRQPRLNVKPLSVYRVLNCVRVRHVESSRVPALRKACQKTSLGKERLVSPASTSDPYRFTTF